MSASLGEDSITLYLAKYNSLKYSFKTENDILFPETVRHSLESLQNPFEFFCCCIKRDEDINKIISFPCQFILAFDKFVTDHEKLKPLLTPTLQLKAFDICKNLKLSVIQNALVNSFSLSSIPNIIVPLLRTELQRNKQAVKVVNMAVMLKFSAEFVIHDLVTPLFLQDKIPEVEKLLNPSPSLQKEFLNMLDGIVGNEILISDLMQLSNCKEIKGQKSPKIIYKLGIRLMKKYNISSKTCPNIMHRHKLSSLRYLFAKHYEENELSLDSLILFAEEISEESDPLKVEVLNLFVEYNDCVTGVSFFQNQKGIPDKDIPHQIKSLLTDRAEMEAARIRQDKIRLSKKLNPEKFYSLILPKEAIHQIKTLEDFNDALCKLQSCSIIGIDTEWKPTLQYDKKEELMLIQIATHDRVYLFDMLYLQSLLTSISWEKLGQLFSNAGITKLTYSFAADTKCLKGFNSKLEDHIKRMSNELDLNKTKKVLIDYYPQFFSCSNQGKENHKGLSEMVYLCFGKPLDKMEQCSFWSARPLSENQISYAALDAFCLLNIYDYLNKKTVDLNFSDWRTLEPDPLRPPASNKNKNKNNFKNNKFKQKKGGHPPFQSNASVPAAQFRVVCDNMLQGLGKQLRLCNMNTTILASSDYHERCVEIYQKERRVILTRGNVFHRLRKYIPQSHLLCVRSDNVKEQLAEVTSRFGVVVREADLLARCSECNGDAFVHMDPKVLAGTKSLALQGGGALPPPATPHWVVSMPGGKGSLEANAGVTDSGVRVRLDEVPNGVLGTVARVYVCRGCGKCYWDGTHMERIRGSVRHVLRPEPPLPLQVPPPPAPTHVH